MIYRCLADYARDGELAAMLRGMSADEVRHYGYFRRIFERYDARERNTTWRKARTLVARSQLVRDEDVRLAFLPLNSCWRGRSRSRRSTSSSTSSSPRRSWPSTSRSTKLSACCSGRCATAVGSSGASVWLLGRIVRRQYDRAA